MMKNDRTTESLLARRALAEKATPGPWKPGTSVFLKQETIIASMGYIAAEPIGVSYPTTCYNFAHIAANSPDVVMADIDEILRLREEMERLEKEADWLAKNLEYACYNKEDGSGCFTCEQLCPELVNEHKMKNRDGYKTCRGATLYGWREAARKAVEEISYE